MNKHNNKNNHKIPFSDGSLKRDVVLCGPMLTWWFEPTYHTTVCEAVGGDEHVPFSQGQWDPTKLDVDYTWLTANL